MQSHFKALHLTLIAAISLLPLGCIRSENPEMSASGDDSRPAVTAVIQAPQDIELQVITEKAQQSETLSNAEDSLVIELPENVEVVQQPVVKAARVRAAFAKPSRVAEEPLEAAVKEVAVAVEVEEESLSSEEATEEKQTEKPQPAIPIFRSPSVPAVSDIDEKATHYQAGLIEVSKGDSDPHRINAFCLDAKGQIVAACGEGPGEVRILDADGKLLDSWKLDIKPEAINVAKDGTILVGGNGKLMRFSPSGKLTASAEAPHAEGIRESKAKLRDQVVQQLKSRGNTRLSLSSRIRTYESIISQLEQRKTDGKLGEQEEQILASLPQTLEIMKKQLAEQPEGEDDEPKVNEAQVEQQLKYMMDMKMRVSSISSDSDHVYVATYALEGYTFNVWQLDQDFKNARVIVEDLRGCCGQMDVQVSNTGIFVAENARFRVACFDPSGELKTTWGKGDRTGADGFTSCCNPMNVCFSKNGDVFTAESNTGRIKRFSADGEFKDFIGDVKLVPGCKNVSIAVSPDGERVYMLDITRNHIVLMKKKSSNPDEAKTPKVTLNNR